MGFRKNRTEPLIVPATHAMAIRQRQEEALKVLQELSVDSVLIIDDGANKGKFEELDSSKEQPEESTLQSPLTTMVGSDTPASVDNTADTTTKKPSAETKQKAKSTPSKSKKSSSVVTKRVKKKEAT